MPQRGTWRARHFWVFLVWLLIYATAWDALGLLVGGDGFFAGPSCQVLRTLSRNIGGMRSLGVPLGALCLVLTGATIWSYGRHSRGHRPARTFAICLSLLAGWYAAWSTAIVWANVLEYMQNHTLLDAGSVSKLVVVTAVAVKLARLPPPPPASYGLHEDPAVNGGPNVGDSPGG